MGESGTEKAQGADVTPGPFKDKADAFKQLSSKDLLEKYPEDPAIQDAAALEASGDFVRTKWGDG